MSENGYDFQGKVVEMAEQLSALTQQQKLLTDNVNTLSRKMDSVLNTTAQLNSVIGDVERFNRGQARQDNEIKSLSDRLLKLETEHVEVKADLRQVTEQTQQHSMQRGKLAESIIAKIAWCIGGALILFALAKMGIK